MALYDYTLCTLRIERLNYIRNTSLYDLLIDLSARDVMQCSDDMLGGGPWLTGLP